MGKLNEGLKYLMDIQRDLIEHKDYYNTACQDPEFNLEVLYFQIAEISLLMDKKS